MKPSHYGWGAWCFIVFFLYCILQGHTTGVLGPGHGSLAGLAFADLLGLVPSWSVIGVLESKNSHERSALIGSFLPPFRTNQTPLNFKQPLACGSVDTAVWTRPDSLIGWQPPMDGLIWWETRSVYSSVRIIRDFSIADYGLPGK
jgi:hypothetical protein